MNECEEQIADRIRVRVWSGFHTLSDVLEMLEDWDEDDEDDFDKQMLEEYAKSEFQAKREAEATWPAVTDCNRLDSALNALYGMGVIALHNAGHTISDGISDVAEVLAESDRDKVKGYCFYHEQDLERAVDSHGLMLAYGDIADTAGGLSATRHWARSCAVRQSQSEELRSGRYHPHLRQLGRHLDVQRLVYSS